MTTQTSPEQSNVVPLRPRLYEAKEFSARTVCGFFQASGTLCGHIDFLGPWGGTFVLSPDEAHAIILMLQQVRDDVLKHSDPLHDPRLI